MKSVSYRARRACFVPGPGVGVENEAREETEVREVVVPCDNREEWSEAVVAVDWTDTRAEGGRERGCEGGGGGADAGGGGGGTRRVFVRDGEELLAEGENIVTGVATTEVIDEGEGEEPCEARILAEPPGWGERR
jgi:hypothetical protein